MYRYRTRPAYSMQELADLYKTPHDHTNWPDHIQRVEKTIRVGLDLWRNHSEPQEMPCIADLSCGDAAIAKGIDPLACMQLGDFAPGYEHTGPIERTIQDLDHQADIFICSETIEHLDDPDSVLEDIREVSNLLLLSTPYCSWPDPNPQHYWSFDKDAVRFMLRKAGWNPEIYDESYYFDSDGNALGYRYQIWGCS